MPHLIRHLFIKNILLSIFSCTLLFSLTNSALAAKDYTLFEVDPVRPVASLKSSGFVAALNIPDDYLELFKPTQRGVNHCASIKVGMRPVAIGVISETPTYAKLWVVNHLSDSVSVIDLNLSQCSGSVVNTFPVGDEPRDIVVANTPVGKRAFITMAHRGQGHPDPITRGWSDLTRTAAENALLGRPAGLADVAVYDPNDIHSVNIINLFTDTPRALTLGAPDAFGFHNQVFAAGFHTGNKTTVIAAETARGVAIDHLHQLMERGDVKASANGDLQVMRSGIKMRGGSPAVVGKGRCMPDPRVELKRRHELQLCAQTDDNHNLIAFKSHYSSATDSSCSCSNAQGEIQPVVSMMVKFYDTPEQCGESYNSGIKGCWLDQNPELKGIATPAMDWSDSVKFSLPDEDVFKLSINLRGKVTLEKSYPGVGTVLFGMATHPKSGKVYVANQDANNLSRFEGFGFFAGTSTRGNIAQSRITIIDGKDVAVKDLNDHLNVMPHKNAWKTSLAFPVAVDITARKNRWGGYQADQLLFFTTLGSDKLSYIATTSLENASIGEVNSRVKSLNLGKLRTPGKKTAAGPVGMSLDQERNRLYLLTSFTNELIVIDTQSQVPKILARHAMYSPEPASITEGRSIFYNATEMSENGTQACASCHIFANNDSLAWDLGNPDIASVNNPGPFVSPSLIGFVEDLAVDPEGKDPFRAVVNPDFRSNKGPMLTLPLRGLANHGAMHWRGDRVRNVQYVTGEHPNTGTLDEDNSIREFDEAVTHLVGGSQPLSTQNIDQLANFLMQISYPPNPLRKLDNSLTQSEQKGRAAFFGCQSMTDEQLANRTCVGTNGQLVKIDEATRECECFGNPIRFVMQRLTYIQNFANSLASAQLPVVANSDQGQHIISNLQHLLDDVKILAQQVANLDRQPLANFAIAGNLASKNTEAEVYDAAQLQAIQSFATGADYPLQINGMLEFINAVKAAEQQLNVEILRPLLAQLDLSTLPAEQAARLADPALISAALIEWFGDANVSRTPLLDARLQAGKEQNPLRGCGLNKTPQSCPLRIADSLTTCQGCHVLNPESNKQFAIEFPGFFGTAGEYAFSNIPQVMKVPHLRNLYSRVGKFGQPHEAEMFVGQSVFGIRHGGFFDRQTPVVGPSVRGYGFSHDGSADTVHRFAGLLDFLRRPAGTLGGNDVRGNPDAFDAFVPKDPAACMGTVVQGRDAFFNQLGADRQQMTNAAIAAISGDKTAAGQIVQTVLTSNAIKNDSRWRALAAGALDALANNRPLNDTHGAPIVEAVASSLLCPNVPSPALLPLCFQLGSTLESGVKDGVCYPEGLKEREAAEAFMLVFDTNLKPMVGQQVSVNRFAPLPQSFTRLLAAAAAGQCDAGGWVDGQGYLISHANPTRPLDSRLTNDRNRELDLGQALKLSKQPITFTCYPPQPNQGEARRSLLDRDNDGVPNSIDKGLL